MLHELAREEDDESQEPEIAEAHRHEVQRGLDQLDLRSLFTGEHDEADCIVQINAKDGGVDAQDWSEMLLRMYERWAERRGFAFGVDAVSEGTEAGILSAEFTLRGPLRLRADDERAGHPPARADQPVRQPGPPPDELRRGAGVADDGRRRRVARRLRHPHGGVPGVRRRRPARQQDVVGRAPDPRADRPRRQLAGGAQPAAEPGEGARPAEGDVAAKVEEERAAELDAIAGKQAQVGWGSQIRSYVLQPYQMVKDLRTEVESGNVAAVLDGDLDEFMEGYLRWRRATADN